MSSADATGSAWLTRRGEPEGALECARNACRARGRFDTSNARQRCDAEWTPHGSQIGEHDAAIHVRQVVALRSESIQAQLRCSSALINDAEPVTKRVVVAGTGLVPAIGSVGVAMAA